MICNDCNNFLPYDFCFCMQFLSKFHLFVRKSIHYIFLVSLLTKSHQKRGTKKKIRKLNSCQICFLPQNLRSVISCSFESTDIIINTLDFLI